MTTLMLAPTLPAADREPCPGWCTGDLHDGSPIVLPNGDDVETFRHHSADLATVATSDDYELQVFIDRVDVRPGDYEYEAGLRDGSKFYRLTRAQRAELAEALLKSLEIEPAGA